MLKKVNSHLDRLKEQPYPHIIKYMGSKSKIMEFILQGINQIDQRGAICDLFAGSASLSGAVRQQAQMHSNDIQEYSSTLARTYLEFYKYDGMPTAVDIISLARKLVEKNALDIGVKIDYSNPRSISDFNKIELNQQQFINLNFKGDWQFFTKTYSGTWWSAHQCLWIDALREVAETYKNDICHPLIMSSLMYAMAYTSQGTGHYAQYRDANTISGMNDISIYRKRDIEPYFIKKYNEIAGTSSITAPTYEHKITSLDFKDCLAQFSGGTVYADPPYCIVHYSRFYHALETLVLYDNPSVQQMRGTHVKGRYREERHQSPFCIKSQVKQAFLDMFDGVKQSNSSLALSYSNTGMITIDEVQQLAKKVFPKKPLEILLKDHTHMTLGRKDDRSREVTECLILIK